MCMYVCLCMRVYLCLHIYILMYVFMYECVCVFVYVFQADQSQLTTDMICLDKRRLAELSPVQLPRVPLSHSESAPQSSGSGEEQERIEELVDRVEDEEEEEQEEVSRQHAEKAAELNQQLIVSINLIISFCPPPSLFLYLYLNDFLHFSVRSLNRQLAMKRSVCVFFYAIPVYMCICWCLCFINLFRI